jgi:hypothetical protein
MQELKYVYQRPSSRSREEQRYSSNKSIEVKQ